MAYSFSPCHSGLRSDPCGTLGLIDPNSFVSDEVFEILFARLSLCCLTGIVKYKLTVHQYLYAYLYTPAHSMCVCVCVCVCARVCVRCVCVKPEAS